MELEKAENIARGLIKKYLTEIGGYCNWEFSWDNAKKRFGCCKFKTQKIQLSRPLTIINTEQNVIDTILHEIAHALAGAKNGHNIIWRRKAMELGCSSLRCGSGDVIEGKYIGVCPNCHKETKRVHKRFNLACGECCKKYNHGEYSEKYKLQYREA